MSEIEPFYFEMDCPCKGKNLDKLLQPSILMALHQQSLHGFALIAEIAKSPLCDNKAPDAAGVYRYLKKMENSGLLTSAWEFLDGEKPRRVYSITDKGDHCLVTWSTVLKKYAYDINQIVINIDKVFEI